MIPKPSTCELCPLFNRGIGFAPAEGQPRLGVLVLGEALGGEEARLGSPFQGAAGHMLNRLLSRVPVHRDQLMIHNVINCQPPSSKIVGMPYTVGAIETCSQYYSKSIFRKDVKIVLTLGVIPFRALLLEEALKIAGAARRGRGSPSINGYVFELEGKNVMPLFHPAFLMKGMQSLNGIWLEWFRKALRIASDGFAYDLEEYVQDPGVDTFLSWIRAHFHYDISFDIETSLQDRYNIKRISFAPVVEPQRAISVPWEDPYIFGAKTILANPDTVKISWNGTFFDIDSLGKNGVNILGKHFDAREAFKFLFRELGQVKENEKEEKDKRGIQSATKPYRLEFAAPLWCNRKPWKYLGNTRPSYYSCVDADVTARAFPWITERLSKQGRLGAFWNDIVPTIRILQSMGERGIPVDKEEQSKLRKDKEAELSLLNGKLQDLVPEQAKKIKVFKKKGTVIYPFNPNSAKDLLRYMAFRDHKIPRSDGKETTEGKELLTLYKKMKDPVYKLVYDCRGMKTLVSRYLWEVGKDGKVHTTYDFTATDRIRSFNPNLQNIIKRKELANALRRTIKAPQGYVFVCKDWKAIESVLTGFFAKDKDFIRVAKLGVHTYMAMQMLGNPLPLDAGSQEYAEAKKVAQKARIHQTGETYYDINKRGNHAVTYGMTPRTQFLECPECFQNTKAAEAWQELFFGSIGKKIRIWQYDVRLIAYSQGFLQNPFGYRLQFYDLYKRYLPGGKQWEWAGSDCRTVLSYLPQSTAAGILRNSLIQLENVMAPLDLPIMNTHDELVFLWKEKEIERNNTIVTKVMTQSFADLPAIDVETTVGKNLADLEVLP